MGPEGAMFGPYRVVRRLGGGAAGEVYLAESTNTSTSLAPGTDGPQQIALKVLSGAAQDATTQDIASKAHAAGQLRQPHLIPFYGVVQHEGRLGVAMAYAPGGSLGDTIARVAPDGSRKLPLPLSSGTVARLVSQLARALTAAHDASLVHGDLKPNNIFVRTAPGGQPLAALSDFGQAMLTGSAAALLARGGTDHWPASQLLFAAPEQLRGEATPASDQYALAAIAYYLLTGSAPISGEGTSLLQAIQRQEVVAPTLRNAEVPAEIDAVLLRALAKEPGSRFPTIALFAQAVDEALAAGVSAGNTSTTVQFSRLAGSTPGMPSPMAAQSVAARSGGQSRQQGASAAAGRPVTPSQTLDVPADAPPTINRRLAIVTAAALVVSILACVFTFRAFQGAAILPHFNLSGPITGINAGPTPTPNATATAIARVETSQWKTATASSPVFKDALAKNDNHWATDGKTVFFASDGLHIHKVGASPAIGVNAPGQLPALQNQRIAATVDITFNSGNPGDLAGMRFFVTPNGGGSEDYYAFLISSEGRYEFWLHQDRTWTFLRSGYSNAFKLGHGQTNTLAVLADSTTRSAALYANGQFLVTVDLSNKGPISGNVGLVVVDGGVDATYTNLTVYAPNA